MAAPWFPPPSESTTPTTPPRRPNPMLAVLVVALVAVIILGTIVAVTLLRGQAKPAPAPSSSPAVSPTTDVVMPNCDVTTLVQFFATPASNTTEDGNRTKFQTNAGDLMTFLCNHSVDPSSFQDPVAGQWNGEAGYFTFSGQAFAWYQSAGNLYDNYYQGDYLWLPGCQTDSGFTLGSTDPCYSIFLQYNRSMTGGSAANDIFYGVFTVTQPDQNTLDITNQRTSTQFSVDRVG